ncbi:Laminin subunit alpha-2 [Leucoagaricus sp. SymC.cos]|nr:Laminin subunit alpha-2 [Leucoagaricus sp. SymC.cos]
MFYQIRHAVESLAVQPRGSTDASSDEQSSPASSQPPPVDTTLGSTSPLSSGQLAGSALSNLRKSFASSRAAPPIARSASMPAAVQEKLRPKLNLEERLRASLSAADISATSSNPPKQAPLKQRSPALIPLPDSPMMSPMDIQDSIQLEGQSNDVQLDDHTTEGVITVTEGENEKKDDDDRTTSTVTHIPPDEGVQLNLTNDRDVVPETASSHGTGGGLQPSGDGDEVGSKLFTALSCSLVGAKGEGEEGEKKLEATSTDISASFKRLQEEKFAADAALRELTPLESIHDAIALREYFQSVNSKTEVFQDEIKRLNGKLEVQEDRIEDLRETHKLSASSQINQIDTLQTQFRESDALFKEAQKSATKLEETISLKEKEIASLRSDTERLNTVVKEEEEKRTKAISLLKSVRQKLVKAEKDKEDSLKEITILREKDKANGEKLLVERQKVEREIENIQSEKEKALVGVRVQFEKEMAGLKERHDREMAAMRGQFELDAITTKSAHNKELTSKNSHITALETSLNNVTRDKNAFFDQLQLRQAEAESAQSHLGSVQHQNTELQYQLREANDRVNLLREVAPVESIAHLLASTESKYEAKVSELKRINATLERERNESEAEWSRKLKARGAEIEELKQSLGNSTKSQEKEEGTVAELKAELQKKFREIQGLGRQLADVSSTCSRLESSQASAQNAASDLQAKIIALEKQLEESKAKEKQYRQTNKTLREELRKVQSSVALLEKQRNPGVGYWTTRTSESSPSDTAATTPTVNSPRVGSPAPQPADPKSEEVNLEYLRNVVLQFLEHKEMRPNLVRVLSIILHFTPQETRRLMAKI